MSGSMQSTELLLEHVVAAINKENSLTHRIKVSMATSQAVQILGSAASVAALL